MHICEYCNTEHDGSYGSGRFCSSKCARKFSQKFVTEDGRDRQIRVLTNPDNREKAINGYRNYCQAKLLSKKDIPKFEKQLSKGFKHPVGIGAIGESATVLKLTQRNIPVAEIIIDLCGVDLLAFFGGKWNTIQVKTSTMTCNDNNIIEFTLTKNYWRLNNHKVLTYRELYSANNVDYFVLYDAIHDELFMVKNYGLKQSILIRYNKQIHGNQYKPNYAEDYQIDNVLDNIEYEYSFDNIVMIGGIDY